MESLRDSVSILPSHMKEAQEMKEKLRELEACRGVGRKLEALLAGQPRVRATATKQLQISRLPKVLCFHLSRRTVCHKTGLMTKIRDKVSFPAELDMAEYAGSSCASSPCSRSSSRAASTSPGLDGMNGSGAFTKYRLCAVIEHDGGAESGEQWNLACPMTH
jgi:ubiquitin C-terminal hydrolase